MGWGGGIRRQCFVYCRAADRLVIAMDTSDLTDEKIDWLTNYDTWFGVKRHMCELADNAMQVVPDRMSMSDSENSG